MELLKKIRPAEYLLLFLFIEACLLLYIKVTPEPLMTITDDGRLYYNLAENLVNGNGLINTVREEDIIVPPLFSLILAPFVLLFDSYAPFIVIQYILFAINGVYVSFLAKKIFKSELTGIITAILYAVHPVLLLNGPQHLLTETIFITFILAVLHLSIKWIKEDKKEKPFYLLLFILTLSLLFRPHLLFLFPVIALFAVYFVWKKKQHYSSFLAFGIPVLLLLLNGLHNYYIHKEFVLLENYSGMNLYIANNPETEIGLYNSNQTARFVEPYYFELQNVPLSEKSAILKEKAFDYILGSPLETLERMYLKFLLFFDDLNIIDLIVTYLSIVGILLAFIKMREQRLILFYMIMYIVGFAALTSLGLLVAGQRYRTPLIPVYLPFAGYLVAWLVTMGRLNKEEKIEDSPIQ